MLVLLSPAKTLDFDAPARASHSVPELVDQSGALLTKLRGLSAKKIAKLMDLSDELATLNRERYQAMTLPPALEHGARQALVAFKGDTYRDMALEAWSEADWDEAQRRLRILSGLFGVLRPLDLIPPYRLEMGTRLGTRRGKDLYTYWGKRIGRALGAAREALGAETTVNLASTEYFRSVDRDALGGALVTPVFRDRKGAQYKVISFFAKRARGAMASWIVRERIQAPEQLRGFTGLGYAFCEAESTPQAPVFQREAQP